MPAKDQPLLGPRFEDALVYAARLHARQTRKSTPIPYVSHLMSVCALVLEDAGTRTRPSRRSSTMRSRTRGARRCWRTSAGASATGWR